MRGKALREPARPRLLKLVAIATFLERLIISTHMSTNNENFDRVGEMIGLIKITKKKEKQHQYITLYLYRCRGPMEATRGLIKDVYGDDSSLRSHR